MIEPIKEADLAATAALIPPVECVCDTCNGERMVYDPTTEPLPGWEERGKIPIRIKIPCPTCEGAGFYLREMTGAEEHYYILHLLTTRYQLR